MVYRAGEGDESSRFGIQYIPHIVIADDAGTKLAEFDAQALVPAHEDGTLVQTVYDKAASFR